jgi:hypothetical protein
MSKMGLTNFYLLREPEKNQCVADLKESSPYEMQRIRCPINPGHSRARRSSHLDMVVPCDQPPDLIFTWMSECLIQERVRRVFASEGLTGYSALRAKAVIKKTRVALPIHELTVTGWGGIAPPASGIREVERCLGCGLLVYSALEAPEKLIDPRNWDGSDFFMIWPLPKFHFVTERVVEVCQLYKITGVSFTQNWHTARGASTSYTPGRLSYYMPRERARLLGAAHGIE